MPGLEPGADDRPPEGASAEAPSPPSMLERVARARLQPAIEVLQRACFRLEELAHDTVQKFELSAHPAPVTLTGPSPRAGRGGG